MHGGTEVAYFSLFVPHSRDVLIKHWNPGVDAVKRAAGAGH